MKRQRIFFSLAVATLSLSAHAQTCTADTTKVAAASTLAVQTRLLAISSSTSDTDVPAAIKPLLHDFKQDLLRTVDLGLRCGQPQPDRIQTDLAQLLHGNRPEKPSPPQPAGSAATYPDDETGLYGDELAIKVSAVPGRPDLYAIQLTYSITCGDDNILLLYRRTPEGWRRTLVYMNPDLNSTGDALGDMFYWSLVPGPDGRPLFAAAHGTPWCTSRVSGFTVDLIAPAGYGQAQRTLDHLEAGYSRTEDTAWRLTPDGFQLRVFNDSLDFDKLFTRPRLYRFRTIGGRLNRIQPVAENARDFVDIWLQTPWSASKAWTQGTTDPIASDRNRVHGSQGMYQFSEVSFGPVEACGGSHYQVEIDLSGDAAGKQTDVPITRYALVDQAPDKFTLLAINPEPDSTCRGPNLMKTTRSGNH